MKTRLLIIIGMVFVGGFVTTIPNVFAACVVNDDWPQKPCLDTPPYSLEDQKQAIGPYYDYKGSEWMEEKKSEMIQALENGNFREWVDAPDDYSHWNVYDYYSIFEGYNYETYESTEFTDEQISTDSCPVLYFLNYAWEDCGSILTWSILGIPLLVIIAAPIVSVSAFVIWRIRE